MAKSSVLGRFNWSYNFACSDILFDKRGVLRGEKMVKEKKEEVYIKPFEYKCKRCHKEIHVRGHYAKKEEFGGDFNKIADHIAKEYEKKGYSKKDAQQIGDDTAGSIYWKKVREAKRGH